MLDKIKRCSSQVQKHLRFCFAKFCRIPTMKGMGAVFSVVLQWIWSFIVSIKFFFLIGGKQRRKNRRRISKLFKKNWRSPECNSSRSSNFNPSLCKIEFRRAGKIKLTDNEGDASSTIFMKSVFQGGERKPTLHLDTWNVPYYS